VPILTFILFVFSVIIHRDVGENPADENNAVQPDSMHTAEKIREE
jgi:hypothetical protein